MSVIDVEALLAEVSADVPAGEDLEYDPAFGEMERLAQGKAEQQMGDEVVAAEEPDWRSVQNQAVELLGRSKDIRIAVYLARALLNNRGFVGFADGLAVCSGLLSRFWDHVHPALDPDDDNDPTMRVNTLTTLFDHDTTLAALRIAPLVTSNVLGSFGLREVDYSSGTLTAPADVEVPQMSAIDGAFLECDIDDLQQTTEAVAQSIEHVESIDATLMERVGASQAADFSSLIDALKAAHLILADRLGRRGVAVEGAEATGEAGGEIAQSIAGEINSREDVVRVLDKVCDYLERHEPSSPVPLLLRRAKRLVSMSFLDIVRDMAPDGVHQAETIGGVVGEDSEV